MRKSEPFISRRPTWPAGFLLMAGLLVLLPAGGCRLPFVSAPARPAEGDSMRMPPETFRYPLARADRVLTVDAEGSLVAAKDYDIVVPGGVGRSTIDFIAEEGSAVTSGTAVLTLSTERLERQLRSARVELSKAEADKVKQERQLTVAEAEAADALRQKLRNLGNAKEQLAILERGADPAEKERSKLKIRSLEAEVVEKARRLETQEELAKKGVVSKLQHQEARDALEKSRLELAKERNLLAKLEEGAQEGEKERLRLAVRKFESEVTLARRSVDEKAALRKLEIQKSQAQVDHRKASVAECERALSQCRLVAPLPGTIVHQENMWGGGRFAVGTQVWGGMRVLKIVQLGKLQAQVAVSEQQIDKVKPGAATELLVRGAPNKTWKAKVARISGVARLREAEDPRGPKDFDVTLDIEGDASGLMPNLQVLARMEVERLAGVFRVPRDAAATTSQTTSTASTAPIRLLVGGPGGLSPRLVSTVGQDQDYVYVRDGLAAGEWLSLLAGVASDSAAAKKPEAGQAEAKGPTRKGKM